jgi:hypothetical protein
MMFGYVGLVIAIQELMLTIIAAFDVLGGYVV